jgi:hypothetical protein
MGSLDVLVECSEAERLKEFDSIEQYHNIKIKLITGSR